MDNLLFDAWLMLILIDIGLIDKNQKDKTSEEYNFYNLTDKQSKVVMQMDYKSRVIGIEGESLQVKVMIGYFEEKVYLVISAVSTFKDELVDFIEDDVRVYPIGDLTCNIIEKIKSKISKFIIEKYLGGN